MKKVDDKLTELFRSNLENAEITPRDGFWEDIQQDLPHTTDKIRHIYLYRAIAAASIFVAVGLAAAIFYMTSNRNSSKQEIAKSMIVNKAVSHTAAMEKEGKSLILAKGSTTTGASEKSSCKKIQIRKSNNKAKVQPTEVEDNDSTVTVTVHMSIRYNDSGNYADNATKKADGVWQTGGFNDVQSANHTENDTQLAAASKSKEDKSWRIKAALNLGMPSTDIYDSPIGGSLTLEKQLSKCLSLESGLQYSYLHSDGQTLHYIGVPLKVNLTLAKSNKIDLYATAGGVADKCVSASGGSSKEPIQLMAFSGLGVRYRFNKALSIYAEPTYTHYFNNGSEYESFRTQRKNSMNLQCGLALTY